MKVWLNRFGSLLAAASILFLVYLAYESAGELLPLLADSEMQLRAGFAVLTYFICHFVAVVVLCGIFETRRYGNFLKLQSYSQIAKYLPGNVFHFVGRIALADNVGIQHKEMAGKTLIELGATVGTGLVMVGLCYAGSVYLTGAVLALALCGFLPQLSKYSLFGTAIPGLTIAFLGYFFIFSATTTALLVLIADEISIDWFELGLANTVAWLLGFVVPGAPGGIGIREMTLYQILDGTLGSARLVFYALVMRFSSILADVIFFLLGLSMSYGDVE